MTTSAGNATATFQSSSTELAMLVRKTQHLLTQSPRAPNEITDTAKQLLLTVRDIRTLVSAANAMPGLSANDALSAPYKALALAVSSLIQLGRDDSLSSSTPVDAAPLRDATSAIVVAIRQLLELVPKSLLSVPASAFSESTRRRRSRSLPSSPDDHDELSRSDSSAGNDPPTSTSASASPVPGGAGSAASAASATRPVVPQLLVKAASARPPAMTSTSPPTFAAAKSPPESPNEQSKLQFHQTMSRLSQMLDDEISMATTNKDSTSAAAAAAATGAAGAAAGAAAARRPVNDDPPAPRKMAPTIRTPPTSSSASPVESRAPRPHAATSLAGDVASQERQLSEALARAKAAHERAERLERDNEQLASTSSTAIAEKMAEIDKLKREIKVLKHATTAPADLVASMQNRDDNEAALEKLKSEHDEMTSLANQEFARRDREVQLLRQLVLEPAFEGWLAKQGGGNLSRAWKDRFFVLRNGVLSYFQNEDDEKPAGFMHIADATVVKSSNTGRDYSFTIQTAKRTYFIAAQNQSQQDAWVDKLGEIIATYAELTKNNQSNGTGTTMEQLWRQRQIQKTKDQLAAIATQK